MPSSVCLWRGKLGGQNRVPPGLGWGRERLLGMDGIAGLSPIQDHLPGPRTQEPGVFPQRD